MATPYIVLLYQWLRSNKANVSLRIPSDDAFVTVDLNETIKQFALNKAVFTKIARLKKLDQDISNLESTWFDCSEDYDGLNNFIGFIQTKAKLEHYNHLQITLNYLLIHPETATKTFDIFNTLFTKWLAAKPQEACAWYENDDVQMKLLSMPQAIYLALGIPLTEHYQQQTRALFALVTNPIGLIP